MHYLNLPAAALATNFWLTVMGAAPLQAVTAEDLVRELLALACEAGSLRDLEAAAGRIATIRSTKIWVRHARGGPRGWRLDVTAESGVVRLDGRGRVGAPLAIEARYTSVGSVEPSLLVVAGADCQVESAERLRYGDDGRPWAIEFLDAAFEPDGSTRALNPAVPDGVDPGGTTVALIDTGINYLLPEIARRLARTPEGEALGRDYQDMDDRAFDVPVHRLFSRHDHGTRIASLLLREAPVVRLVPFRYPHARMERMRALIAAAAAAGARIVNVSLAGPDAAPWRWFVEAARREPGLLFVIAAGNHGRDLDQRPVFPAAAGLDNFLVVTSASADGALTRGANWGAKSVDLMVRGENLEVLDVSGRSIRVSGSSYAAARRGPLRLRAGRRS